MPVSATRLFSNKNRSISKFKGYRRRPSRLAVKMTPSVKGREKFTAGKSVRAVAKKSPQNPSERPEAHSDPTGRTGWNTAYNTPGEYDKAIKYQQTEQKVKLVKPKKSFGKSIARAVFGRRGTMRKAKFS